MTEPKVFWKPTPKQAEFLSCAAFEVLYGGAAGGGKSEALIIGACGLPQKAILNPSYRAILFRKTFKETRDLVDKSRGLYPKIYPGAIFKESTYEWSFPSGATIAFSYLDAEADCFAHQGQEYQYVGFDELTLRPSDKAYKYLISRLRSTDPNLKCFLRATCNPGGVGHSWVRDRFKIPNEGTGTSQTLITDDVKTRRVFIPARLSDNPHLTGTGYRERLMGMDEMEQRALLDGRWDVIEVKGSIYKKVMMEAHAESRIRRVICDRSITVNTAWDLGVSDHTCIIFYQLAANEIRIIDYYENSGEGLPHYIQILQQKNYVYGHHYAPHDIKVREFAGNGNSRLETAKSLGVRFEIAPQMSIYDGIQAVRGIMNRCFFDTEKTSRLVDCLSSYRWKINATDGTNSSTPEHDWASDGADAFRYLAVSLRKPQEHFSGDSGGRVGGWYNS